MHIRLLGTAAAEGWPAVFCRCESCARARVAGGKNIRTRSGATVDGRYQFDFGPDAYHHALAGNDLSAVEHLIFTHSHQDHLAPADLDMRRPPFAHGVTHPLRLWGNGSVVSAVRAKYPSPEKLGLELTQLNPFEPVEIGHATVVPLLADHDKS